MRAAADDAEIGPCQTVVLTAMVCMLARGHSQCAAFVWRDSGQACSTPLGVWPRAQQEAARATGVRSFSMHRFPSAACACLVFKLARGPRSHTIVRNWGHAAKLLDQRRRLEACPRVSNRGFPRTTKYALPGRCFRIDAVPIRATWLVTLLGQAETYISALGGATPFLAKPAIAQLVEHLTVD